MTLSRSESFRRIPRISWSRWLIIIFGFIVFVIVSAVLYVRDADSNYRAAEHRAVRIAKQQAELTDIDRADLHTWEENVWIVTGKDAKGEAWMVWERPSGLLKYKISENFSKSQMLSKFKAEHNGVEPNRILPAWYQGVPAWEIRYNSNNGGQHEAIDFYAFKDGMKLITFDLPTQRY
jgi:uncharacterized protein YpmB